MYEIFYTEHSRQDLKKLERNVLQRILTKLDFYIHQKNPLKFAKPLTNPILGQYRFRIGDYRILFDVTQKGQITVLMILRIKHRKDVYFL